MIKRIRVANIIYIIYQHTFLHVTQLFCGNVHCLYACFFKKFDPIRKMIVFRIDNSPDA